MALTTTSPRTGRRKHSVARVRLMPGAGKHTVNDRVPVEYFKRETLVQSALRALVVANSENKYDLLITVKGGGLTGQAGAIRLGVARALLDYNPELRKRMKVEGLLTRDPRAKERKKYGQPGARKRFQYSKR